MAKNKTKYSFSTRHSPVYNAWAQMKNRCSNPNYSGFANYGGRGISVCEEWLSFAEFYKDMGEKPKGMTLERVDVNGGYSKENCKWATPREQSLNRRNTRLFTFGGKSMVLTDWAKFLKVKRSTLAQRFYVYKWPLAKCLKTI